jgi:hypothetical protein
MKLFLAFVVFTLLLGLLTWVSWNHAVVPVFEMPRITYLQACLFTVLVRAVCRANVSFGKLPTANNRA